MSGSNALAHFTDFAEQLGRQELAYLYVREGDMMTKTASLDYAALRAKFGGTYIANNGYDLQRAQGAVRAGAADLIAFGLPFLANPDLVRRFKQKLSLNVDPTAFYTGAMRRVTPTIRFTTPKLPRRHEGGVMQEVS